jgi:hypothetical protein
VIATVTCQRPSEGSANAPASQALQASASRRTASFCNADDALLPGAALWLHGHLHCRHDYVVAHPDGGRTRVVSQARGLEAKAECEGYDPQMLIEV